MHTKNPGEDDARTQSRKCEAHAKHVPEVQGKVTARKDPNIIMQKEKMIEEQESKFLPFQTQKFTIASCTCRLYFSFPGTVLMFGRLETFILKEHLLGLNCTAGTWSTHPCQNKGSKERTTC